MSEQAHLLVTSTSLAIIETKTVLPLYESAISAVAKHVVHPQNKKMMILVCRNRRLGFAYCHLLSFGSETVQ